jgi:hypothetical protein
VFRCALFDADPILLIVMFLSLAGAMRGGNGEFYLSKRGPRKGNKDQEKGSGYFSKCL